mmetsp:Transcript_38763/g.102944  ORF Transcript_38763/g.102944 Transcript_38763/m.102944 type:complete len:342 (-) Transcript_38763:13-1038(-)
MVCSYDVDETFLLSRVKVMNVAEARLTVNNFVSAPRQTAVTHRSSPSAHQQGNMLVMPLLPVIALPVLLVLAGFILCFRTKKKDAESTSLSAGLMPRNGSVHGGSVRSVGSKSSSSKVDSKAHHCLCTDLVVPPYGECVFALPVLQMPVFDDPIVREVTDKNGNPLLRLALTRIACDQLKPTQSEFVVLGRTDDQELAFCELELPASGQGDTRCSIFCTSGDLFAHVEEERHFSGAAGERSFIVYGVAPLKWRLRFHGDFVRRKVYGINVHTGRPVAVVASDSDFSFDTAQEHYKVRLGPLADSGLVLVSLVVIDRILYSSQRSSDVPRMRTDLPAAQSVC